jgi:hypothetical protein
MTTILLLIIFLLHNNQAVSQTLRPNVSIFDVKQEKVIKVIPLTIEMLNLTLNVLQASPEIYSGFTLNPKNGFILHIPFTTPIKVNNPLYPDKIKEIYLFLEEDEKIKALLFFESAKSRIVVLNYDAKKFIEESQLSELWIQSTKSVSNST